MVGLVVPHCPLGHHADATTIPGPLGVFQELIDSEVDFGGSGEASIVASGDRLAAGLRATGA